MPKHNGSLLFIIIVTAIASFIGGWFLAKQQFGRPQPATEAWDFTYVVTNGGQQLLCWNQKCGWVREADFAAIFDQNPSSAGVPAVVHVDVPSDGEIQKRIVIGHYSAETSADPQSPIKAFVIGKKYGYYSSPTKDGPRHVRFDVDTGEHKDVVIYNSNTFSVWPIGMHPTHEEWVLVLAHEAPDRRLVSLVNSESNVQGARMYGVSAFGWKDTTYVATTLDGETYECPFFADINNCDANTRSKAFAAKIGETKTPIVVGDWILFSVPEAFESEWSDTEGWKLIGPGITVRLRQGRDLDPSEFVLGMAASETISGTDLSPHTIRIYRSKLHPIPEVTQRVVAVVTQDKKVAVFEYTSHAVVDGEILSASDEMNDAYRSQFESILRNLIVR